VLAMKVYHRAKLKHNGRYGFGSGPVDPEAAGSTTNANDRAVDLGVVDGHVRTQ
jgi:hypothetical protein